MQLLMIGTSAFFASADDVAMGGMAILMLIASVFGFVLAIVWLIFPFLVLSRLKEIAALQRTQGTIMEQMSAQLASLDGRSSQIADNTYASAENSATALKIQTQDQNTNG